MLRTELPPESETSVSTPSHYLLPPGLSATPDTEMTSIINSSQSFSSPLSIPPPTLSLPPEDADSEAQNTCNTSQLSLQNQSSPPFYLSAFTQGSSFSMPNNSIPFNPTNNTIQTPPDINSMQTEINHYISPLLLQIPFQTSTHLSQIMHINRIHLLPIQICLAFLLIVVQMFMDIKTTTVTYHHTLNSFLNHHY